MFYQSFVPQKKMIPTYEFPIFVNKIEIDDSFLKIGSLTSRKKEFIGWGPMRGLVERRDLFNINDNEPVFLLSLGIW